MATTPDMKKAKELIRCVYENHPLVLAEDGITVYVNELAGQRCHDRRPGLDEDGKLLAGALGCSGGDQGSL